MLLEKPYHRSQAQWQSMRGITEAAEVAKSRKRKKGQETLFALRPTLTLQSPRQPAVSELRKLRYIHMSLAARIPGMTMSGARPLVSFSNYFIFRHIYIAPGAIKPRFYILGIPRLAKLYSHIFEIRSHSIHDQMQYLFRVQHNAFPAGMCTYPSIVATVEKATGNWIVQEEFWLGEVPEIACFGSAQVWSSEYVHFRIWTCSTLVQ